MKSRFTTKSSRAVGALGLIAVLAACDSSSPPTTLAELPPAGALGVATAALTSSATIQRGTFGSVADATISANDMRKNYGTQKKLGVSWKDEALLRFDLSSIPHAVIDRATLTVFVNGEEGRDDDDEDGDCHDDHDRRGSQGAPITLHRVTRAWSESTVTYANFAQRFDINDCPATNPCNHGVCVDGTDSYTALATPSTRVRPAMQKSLRHHVPKSSPAIRTLRVAHIRSTRSATASRRRPIAT